MAETLTERDPADEQSEDSQIVPVSSADPPEPAPVDAEPEPEPQPEPEPEDEPAVAAAVSLEDEYGALQPGTCPLCEGSGNLPVTVPQSPRYQTCPDCHGLGQVRTGSLVADSAIIGCERCTGSGFSPIDTAEAPYVPPLQPQNGAGAEAPPWPGAVKDAAGNWH
jgi:hypothetical protein